MVFQNPVTYADASAPILVIAETSYSPNTLGEEISCFSLINDSSWLAVHVGTQQLSEWFRNLSNIWGKLTHLIHHPHELSKLWTTAIFFGSGKIPFRLLHG